MTTNRYRVQYTHTVPGGTEYREDRLMLANSVDDILRKLAENTPEYHDTTVLISICEKSDGVPVVVYDGRTDC